MPFNKNDSEVIPGHQYLLDNRVVVTVIKSINRSKTSFSVEITGRGVETVGKERLFGMQVVE